MFSDKCFNRHLLVNLEATETQDVCVVHKHNADIDGYGVHKLEGNLGNSAKTVSKKKCFEMLGVVVTHTCNLSA